jgi:N-methylhydantoinase A
VGIDVGGTFTDAALLDAASRLRIAKVRTTPREPAAGFVDALDELSRSTGIPVGALDYLAHGSTVATNAAVQGRLARVGLLTTAGFRDVLEIGTQQRASLYDPRAAKPAPLVPRELRREARERVGPHGETVEPLRREDVERAARAFAAAGVEAVAVAFLFSFADGSHEREAGEILERRLPGVPVSLSSEVAAELREFPRTSTTALNAALLPLVGGYVERLAALLAERGVAAPLHLMRSNGGVAVAEEVSRLPVGLIASGPAAGVIGAAQLGRLAGLSDVLTFDMGGTTADVSLAPGGRPGLRFRGEAAGHPVSLPQIDVLSVGAGGGSIARVDRFGSLRVGPESAGAEPGPACYGLGGEEATVTDAHVVLGTLDPSHFLGGRLALDRRAARRAVERRVAKPLGLGVEEAAAAVLRIADATMVQALRVISIARGHDPRRAGLVAFGGAGPMHACAIAEELGIPRVVVPRYPGVASALGLLLSDVRHDLARTWVRPLARVRPRELEAAIAPLERHARELLADAGFDGARGRIEVDLDVRYRGQAYELTVPLRTRPAGAEALRTVERAFHAAHRRAYGHDRPVEETEIVTVRVRATGKVRVRPEAWSTNGAPRRPGPGGASARGPYAVHQRDEVRASLTGPAIVEQDDSTILVPAGWRLRPGPAGNAILERRGRR